MSKTYIVMGASGQIGHHLVEHLSQKGHHVKAIGRDEKRLSRLKKDNVEIFVLKDFAQESRLQQIFQRADGLFAMIPPSYETDDMHQFQNQVGAAISEALKKAPIPFVVNLSSLGAERPSGTGVILGLHLQEKRLSLLSDLHVLHLRCGYFMENFFWSVPIIKKMNLLAGPLKAHLPLWLVATKDIGKKAAELLDKTDFKGHQILDFVGPQEVTMENAAKILGKAIDKPKLTYLQAPFFQIEKGMLSSGMKPKTVKLLLEMYQAVNEKMCEPTQKISSQNRGETTLEEFSKIFADAYNHSPSPSNV